MSTLTHPSVASILPIEPGRARTIVAEVPEALFSSFQINGFVLPNRVVTAPMTRSFSPGGVPTDAVAGRLAAYSKCA